MRQDMYKVIVERPRAGKKVESQAAKIRDRLDGPRFAGMRAGLGRPWLNENLSPLRRYLMRQVGRPWNAVHSEIAAHIDRRNTVQQHIYQHLDDFIAMQVEWRDGELVDLKRRCSWRPQPLYVDPRTGLVRRNRHDDEVRRQYRLKKAREAEAIHARRRQLSEDRWLLKLDGLWYALRLAELPEVAFEGTSRVDMRVFDVVLKAKVRRYPIEADIAARQRDLYGSENHYAIEKRQLSKKELKAFGLSADMKHSR
jgi:hypothetical protein